jgi:hypothetical protein
VEQVARREQREQHQHRLFNLRRSRNIVGRQRDDRVRSEIPRKAGQARFRVSDSARRHLLAQLNMRNLAAVHRLDFISRSHLRLAEDARMKHARNEKECRALTLSHLRHNSTSSRSSGSKVARLPQPITARATDSPKVDRRDNQRKRQRQGRINFGAITPAAPE